MSKKKILFCTEATFLNTGYASYTREVMTYLASTGKYELAELSAYGQRSDPRGSMLPWKYFGVNPNRDFMPLAREEELQAYHSNPIHQFGSFIFESVCLEFQPDIVFDIRDFWMTEFINRSPYRNCFKFVLMPTVDAAPQARQWIDMYIKTDAIFSYSEWAGEVLQEQTGGKINYLGTASPCANKDYIPIPQKEARDQLGLSHDIKIIGTVMRNQRRKLYPDLFASFRLFLEKVKDPDNYFLYCHTYYPDLGWDIPELLQDYDLSSKVLFTYICRETGKVFSSLYCGPKTESPFTRTFCAEMCNVRIGATTQQLSLINNCFDLYIQYANSEGFGIPLVEAAACGIPIAAINYSAMSSILENLEGIKLEPKALYKELETGCFRAVPDNENTSELLLDFFGQPEEERKAIGFKTRSLYKTYYNWGKTGRKLEECFDILDTVPVEEGWLAPPRIVNPASIPKNVEGVSYRDLARWLILKVLGEPEKLNTYFEARLIRDLTYGSRTSIVGGVYHNESSAAFDGKSERSLFTFEIAYEETKNLCINRNNWEKRRTSLIGEKV